MLSDCLLAEASRFSDQGAWNFGPNPENCVPVIDVANLAMNLWGSKSKWTTGLHDGPQEAGLLSLDSSKAPNALGWTDRLTLDEAVRWTVDWHRATRDGEDSLETSLKQIRAFASR